jgi:hypothetical protein
MQDPNLIQFINNLSFQKKKSKNLIFLPDNNFFFLLSDQNKLNSKIETVEIENLMVELLDKVEINIIAEQNEAKK